MGKEVMQTVTADFTSKQKSEALGTVKQVKVNGTDVTAYVIKGGMSPLSIDLEGETLNAFKVKDITVRCSNHDETFFDATSTGLFDDLSSQITAEVNMGISGLSPLLPCEFKFLVERDSIKRIRENIVEFTCYGYGKQLEGVQWDGSTPSNKSLYELVDDIVSDADVPQTSVDYDVIPIAVTDKIVFNYCEQISGLGNILNYAIDDDYSVDDTRRFAFLEEDSGAYTLYAVRIDIVTGRIVNTTSLEFQAGGSRWQNLWYYDDAFWMTQDTGDGTEVTDIVRVTTGGVSTDFSLVDSGWTRKAEWFYQKGQYIYFAEESTSGNNARVKRFDMSAGTPAVDHTAGTQNNYDIWSRPVYETEDSKIWVILDSTTDGYVWASYHIGTSTWDTTNAWPTGGGSLTSAANYDVGVMGDPGNAKIYFPDDFYDVGSDTWNTVDYTVEYIKESPATGGLFAYKTSDDALVELVGTNIVDDRNKVVWTRGGDHPYPPPEVASDIMLGMWGSYPVVAREGIIPMVNYVALGEDSYRDILANLAATFMCTIEITDSTIYFWSRNSYRDAFNLTKDLYSKATQTQWDHWCDGLLYNIDTNQYTAGTTGGTKRVMEIDGHYLGLLQTHLGQVLADAHYAFYGSKRRMFEVDAVYLIQLELLDRVTLSWLSGTVATHLHSLHYDDRTKLTKLKLLEEV